MNTFAVHQLRKASFQNVLNIRVIVLERSMICQNIRYVITERKKFSLESEKISEFREDSQKSLLLTGTPSVCNSKL